MSGVEKITLKAKGVGSQEFDIDHAQRILVLEASIGEVSWEIVGNKHEFKDGKIVKRAGSGVDQEPKE